MVQIADIPVIGGVLHAFIAYFSTSAKILRNPFGFARSTDVEDHLELKKAWEFLYPSVIVSYLVCIPALLKHNSDISQSIFIVSQFLRMALVLALLHVALRVLGSRRPLRTTFIVYCYTAGLFLPIMMLVFYL